jgi:hypothetical protein
MISSHPVIPLRFTAIICSLLLLLSLSGCATRALMSSDRYEKPEPETPPQSQPSSSAVNPDVLKQLYLAQQ